MLVLPRTLLVMPLQVDHSWCVAFVFESTRVVEHFVRSWLSCVWWPVGHVQQNSYGLGLDPGSLAATHLLGGAPTFNVRDVWVASDAVGGGPTAGGCRKLSVDEAVVRAHCRNTDAALTYASRSV